MLKRNLLIIVILLVITTSAHADVSGFLFDSNTKFSFWKYFISLLITIILEVCVGLFYFERWNISRNNIKYIIYCNLITHPAFWLTGELIGWNFGFTLIGELVIIVIESFLLTRIFKIDIPGEYLILLSFIMNLISAVIGGWIYLSVTN